MADLLDGGRVAVLADVTAQVVEDLLLAPRQVHADLQTRRVGESQAKVNGDFSGADRPRRRTGDGWEAQAEARAGDGAEPRAIGPRADGGPDPCRTACGASRRSGTD